MTMLHLKRTQTISLDASNTFGWMRAQNTFNLSLTAKSTWTFSGAAGSTGGWRLKCGMCRTVYSTNNSNWWRLERLCTNPALVWCWNNWLFSNLQNAHLFFGWCGATTSLFLFVVNNVFFSETLRETTWKVLTRAWRTWHESDKLVIWNHQDCFIRCLHFGTGAKLSLLIWSQGEIIFVFSFQLGRVKRPTQHHYISITFDFSGATMIARRSKSLPTLLCRGVLRVQREWGCQRRRGHGNKLASSLRDQWRVNLSVEKFWRVYRQLGGQWRRSEWRSSTGQEHQWMEIKQIQSVFRET